MRSRGRPLMAAWGSRRPVHNEQFLGNTLRQVGGG
jgi:hypothetical protein